MLARRKLAIEEETRDETRALVDHQEWIAHQVEVAELRQRPERTNVAHVVQAVVRDVQRLQIWQEIVHGLHRERAKEVSAQVQGLEHGKASQNARNRCERLLRQAQLLCDQGCLAKVVKQELQALRYVVIDLGPGWHRRRSSHRERRSAKHGSPRVCRYPVSAWVSGLREEILGVQGRARGRHAAQ